VDLTVVTSTVPERAGLFVDLERCMSVQTVKPKAWAVHVDHERRGPAECINELVAGCTTDWVFRCDDDDLFDADHFEYIAPHLHDAVDIVYTWPRVDPPGWIGETGLQVNFPIENLRDFNWIASAAAVRRSVWDDLGGYRSVHNEDHDLWRRAMEAGARFRCIQAVTWTYRLGDWPHLSQPET
jgi:hypothetical protein